MTQKKRKEKEYLHDAVIVFHISDSLIAETFANNLSNSGMTVICDKRCIHDEELAAKLDSSRILILFFSSSFLADGWPSLERPSYNFRDPENANRLFLPIKLFDSPVPETLKGYNVLNYKGGDNDDSSKILDACWLEDKSTTKKQSRRKYATLSKILKGHIKEVTSIIITGNAIISGSKDASIISWEKNSILRQFTISKNLNPIQYLAHYPQERQFLSGSKDGKICIWNDNNGKMINTWSTNQELILSYCSNVSTNHIATISKSSIKIWSTNGDLKLEIRLNRSNITASYITSNGEMIYIGNSLGEIIAISTNSTIVFKKMKGHSSRINAIIVLEQRNSIFTASEDHTIKIWNLDSMNCIGTLEGHKSGVRDITVSPDMSVIASAGNEDQTIRIWDIDNGHCMQEIKGRHRDFYPVSLAFSPDGLSLAVGTLSRVYTFKVKQNLKKLNKTSSTKYTNAKVVLLGESGVGKSGLAHRLIEDKFKKTDSTHGMQVWKLDIPIENENDTEREVLLWDLAGQEDYRLIHQLFVEETALALLLINPQKEDPFIEIDDWLKIMQAVTHCNTREISKILIAARIDVGNIKISIAKINRYLKDNGISSYIDTSAKRGDNCSDSSANEKYSKLKNLIARHIPWHELPWTSTPNLLRKLKTAVISLIESENIRLIRFPEVIQRLKIMLPEFSFNPSDVRTTITLLANHGLIMPLKFGDLVLLHPEVLNGYASSVIRSAREHIDEIGAVSEEEVFSKAISFDGFDRLPDSDEDLLLRAMVQTFLDKSMCIAENTPDGRQLIFPSQYRRERFITSTPDLFVSYSFNGEVATIYTTLIVRLWYSREFENKELWKNAVEFTTSKGHVLGLLLRKNKDTRHSIGVFFHKEVPDELKVVFIEYIHQHLIKNATDLQRDRRYICKECSEPVVDIEAVRKRLSTEKKFILCQYCDMKVPLIDHIETRLSSDPVARKVFGMDQIASAELDSQAREQILIGHMMAISGEANQIFRPVSMFDYGIDGEIEFRDDHGNASGKKIYVQLKSGDSYLYESKKDDTKIFRVKNERHLDYWLSQPVNVFLVIRYKNEITWMNITEYLQNPHGKNRKKIIFNGSTLTVTSLLEIRDSLLYSS